MTLRRRVVGFFGILALTAILSSAPQPVRAECGIASVSVDGTPLEIAATCAALAEVTAFFAELGLVFEPAFSLSFLEEVFFEFEGAPGAPPHRVYVLGYYDRSRKAIHLTKSDSALREERRPWGLPWGAELWYSVLQHELVHMAAVEILGCGQRRLCGAWMEFVAYAVQFELMPPAMRDDILARHADLPTFASTWEVNAFRHAFDPDAFGIMSQIAVRSLAMAA